MNASIVSLGCGLNHTALPGPDQLLVEEHHHDSGEPWARSRGVFNFHAYSVKLSRFA
ncbi:hypothetical protein L1049_011375 [Liquidambar formosana]|uniref:Uncharacterized protein n=1 Tax=Liquidambar formosana TaxID=63359 RepID=A0AAP0RWW4_LIQFO